MCIIVVKPRNEELPSKEILKNCFVNNNDGAGFSFTKDNRIYLSKGYTKFKPFYRNVKQFIKKDTSAILHFRIASVGKVCDTNCHPFVISEDKRELDKTVNCTKQPIFAHNGSLSISASNGRSDTIQYARIIGDPLIRNNMFRNNSLMKILESSIGHSKMAFMNRKGQIKLLGDFEKEKGLFFSNFSFRYRTTVIRSGWAHGWNQGEWKKNWEKKDEDYDKDVPVVPTKEEKEEEEEVIYLPKAEDKKNIILQSIEKKDVERYPIGHCPCDVCLRDKLGGIKYYPGLDSCLCDYCYDLYYGQFTEEVKYDSKEKVQNKEERRNDS